MLRKNLVVGAVASGVIIGGLVLGASIVGAQDSTNPQQNLIQRIAQKFNLNETEVKGVFDQFHQEKLDQMKTNFENRLNQAVKDGKITDVQKQAILKRFQDLKSDRPDMSQYKNMTPEQRMQVMQQKKQDLENWASQNGISLQTLQELLGGPNRGFGMMHRMGMMKYPSSSPSTQ